MSSPDHRIEVYGHAWAQQLLRRAQQRDATSHAYLFLGPEHIGKTTLARAFAQALTCEQADAEEGLGACGRCRACRLAAEGMHPDHRFIEPQGKQLVIEQIREVVREAARSPIEARYKVFIITSFERANANAANALLKTLEEPSASTRIILISHQPSGMLDTIISRCQLLRLRPLPEQTIIQALKERAHVSESEALRLARLSNGRMGAALALAAEPNAWQRYNERIERMLAIIQAPTLERMAAAQALEKTSHLETTLQEWLMWWRDVWVLQNNAPGLIVNQEHAEKLKELARRLPSSQVRRFISAIIETSEHLQKNVNRQLALEALLLKAPVDR